MGRRALITGATGFLGQRLARVLNEAGWSVAAVGRDPARARAALPELDAAFTWKEVEDGSAFDGADAVAHLAGEPVAGLWTAKKRERIEKSRVEGTRRLVDGMRAAAARPRVLASASAVGYYGEPDPSATVEEDHPPGDDFLARVCVAWEREAERAAELGVRVARLRMGLVLGRGGGALGAMLPAFKAGLGGKIGSGRQLWPWVHEEDVARMWARALEDEAWSGAYNVVAPEPIEQARFAKTLAAVLHRPAFLPAPAFAVRSVLRDFANELLVSRRVVPARALAAGFEHRFRALEPALRDVLDRPR